MTMAFTAAFDFARVAGALLMLFFVLPILARRTRPQASEIARDIARSFLQACLFFEIATLILGNWRICFTGLMTFLVLCWLAATNAFASPDRWIWDASEWRSRFLRVLEWSEAPAWRKALGGVHIAWTDNAVLMALLLLCMLAERSWFAFDNYRFLGSLTYERAVSLQTLIHGDPWHPDGSVALLAPLSQFSGTDGATVVRFAGPLFGILLAIAGGYCAWVYSRRFSAAYLACGLLALYPSKFGLDSVGELAGPEMACLFWILAVAMLRESWKYAIAAGALAVMIHPLFTPVMAASLLIILLALLLVWTLALLPRFVAKPARWATALLFAVLLIQPLGLPAGSDGPYQYESAARAAARIARTFPHNRWMIVSPAQELAATYGRGWHVELSEFVREYTPSQLSRPEFRFPYSIRDLFVFVEKEPLRQPVRNAALADDDYSYRYFTQNGRTTLEFQTAALMAAYAAGHTNISVYYEDEHIVVYRVTTPS
jgi:hypothetical protein